jgi:ectoine hydroxylase-related dioxygenase (phytanoyl-CoA dioxygenase family)
MAPSHKKQHQPGRPFASHTFLRDMGINENDDTNNTKNSGNHESHRCRGSSIAKQFETHGFVGPIDVLTLSDAKAALQEVQNELASSITPTCIDDRSTTTTTDSCSSNGSSYDNNARFKLHLILPKLDSIAHHPIIVDTVQQVLQTDNVVLWSSDVNIKPSNSFGFFAPHQDSTYTGLSPPTKCVTVWIALSDPVGENEGCLSFYPKSHLYGQIPHQTVDPNSGTTSNNHHHNNNNNSNNMLSLGQFISKEDLQKVQDAIASSSSSCSATTSGPSSFPQSVPLRGGQMTVHSFLTIHQSGPNQSLTTDRVGFALRYMDGRDVIQTKPIKEMVTWISGTATTTTTTIDQSHNDRFDIEPRLEISSSSHQPTERAIQRGRFSRLEAIRREEANYFDSGR